MLTIFRRHLKSCKYRSRRFKGCTCPISVEGRLHGEYIRKSLEVRNWDSAQKLVRDWEAGEKRRTVPLHEACERFYRDAAARGLGAAQLGKYKLLTEELKRWFPERVVASMSVEDLRAYRESWDISPVTASKKLERVRTFFKFCQESGWINDNPARLLKAPKVKMKPTLPFTDGEMEKILWACDLYLEKHPRAGKEYAAKLKAFVLLLRHSGLRIRDAVTLRRGSLVDGRLLLYTAKTGTSVYVPLPEVVLEALAGLSNVHHDYFFWSARGNPKSAVADWQRTLKGLFTIAGIQGHAHRFRDTFAVSLLQRGVSLENVAVLLGHSNVLITNRHYAPWVKSRQESLEREVKKAWE